MSVAPEDHPNGDDVDLSLPEDTPLSVDPQSAVVPKQDKNYEIKAPVVTDMTDEQADKFQDIMVPVLPDTADAVNADLESSKIGEVDISEDSVSWYQNLLSGFVSHPAHGIFEDALANPNASWRNTLSFAGSNINIGRPKFTNKGRGAKMSSERLQLSIRAKLGLGSPVQVPLMASGFYATVKPLGEDEIISMWREVLAETVKLGRKTHGLLFSNNQVFTARAIYQHWVGSLVETTVSDLPIENLSDHITINDMPLIAHSVATAVYPNGFPLKRSVFTEDTKLPKGEVKQLIDVRKSLFMDANMFNDAQLSHMVKRIEQPMTLKTVKDYRDGFVFNQNTVVDIGEGVKLHLHTPSLREWFDSGEKWINEIQAAVHAALGADADERKRLAYISQLALASRLRQYSHYIKAIEEDGELYTTRENVDKVLTSLSTSDEISKKFFKAVSDYINKTQVALIATTSVNEYEDTKSGDKWPRLIPIDSISVFFQLVEQKLHGITSRSLEDTSD
jgi:hypothetical protein